MKKQLTVLFLVLTITFVPFASGQPERAHLRLAITASTENSGLIDILIPPFEKDSGIKVDLIAVGTGKAVSLGKNGDVDLIFVHARAREDAFVAEGFGINRRDVMFNDFVIVGPADDPAGIRELTDGARAFQLIRDRASDFLSRGDDSGTHIKEKALWSRSGSRPGAPWYKETGQSMGKVLIMADEMNGYTLTDRGTYLSMKDKLTLEILVEGDPQLFNPYGIIAINPARHDNINGEGATAFIDFITSTKGQDLINNFKIKGEQLFFGNASR